MDDIITWSDTVEVAFQSIFSILSHCNTNGLVFNSEKFRFARREVEFGGIKPPAKYTAAIRDFPTPCNISEVGSWYGHLLSPNTLFEWTDELEEAFAATKEKILELIQQGMGWILQQKTCECQKISPTCCPDGWRLGW